MGNKRLMVSVPRVILGALKVGKACWKESAVAQSLVKTLEMRVVKSAYPVGPGPNMQAGCSLGPGPPEGRALSCLSLASHLWAHHLAIVGV